LINMLAFLGWNPGTEQEIFSLEELIEAFDLKKVNKAGARFDLDKTKWFQTQYLQNRSDEELAKLFIPIVNEKINVTSSGVEKSYIKKVISLIKERATFVHDFWELSSFFFIAPKEFDAKASKKAWKDDTADLMQELVVLLKDINNFTTENVETKVKEWITSKEIGFGKVMMPLRLSLVGAMQGPHLFDIMSMIGKDETIGRILYAIKSL